MFFFVKNFKSFYWLGLHIRQRSFLVLIRENALSIFCRHNVAPSRKTVLLSPLLGLTVSCCCRCHHHHFAEKKREQGKLHRLVYLEDCPGLSRIVQDCQRLLKISKIVRVAAATVAVIITLQKRSGNKGNYIV